MTLPDRKHWNRLSPLLDELLGLSAKEREQRLSELRRREEPLARELESLLGAAGRADAVHFLEGDASGPQAVATDLIGKHIGAYVIEAPLGEGGTGSVWRARRADGRFEGSVAVKLLHMSLLGRSGALRFKHEGVILARLTHPNIARLLDAGLTTQGQPYLVLELVEGQRIDRHCDALRLDVEQRLSLFADVLGAVAHAHSHLVIHRDIKPNNILVTPHGSVKLLDFGIAKLLQEESEALPVTLGGQRVLTPEYAAPEQLQGGPVTTATDVYALGVLLYQLLSGRHPTAADNAGAAEMMRATLDTDPARLATALTGETGTEGATRIAAERSTALPRLRRQLRGDLENIVARTLRKDPAERYQTVAALAQDLHHYRAHEPVSARADSLAYRAARFVRRRRGMVAASLLIVLAIVAGLAGTVTQAQRAAAQALMAQHERDNALRQLAYAKSSNEFITFLLQEGSDKPFTTAELLARAEAVLEKQFADDPAQRAHLLVELAGLHVGASNIKKAETLLLRARAAAHDVPDVSLQAGSECLLAYVQGLSDSFDLAQQTFDSAIAKLRAAPEVDHALLAECLQFRGDVADMGGNSTAALTDAKAALDTLGMPRPEDRTLAVAMHNSLAIVLGKLGQSAAGAAEFRRAIAELEALGRGRTRQANTLHQNLGALLSRAGQARDALQSYERALDIARGLGGVPPSLEAGYAYRLIDLGRPRDAMPLIERAVDEAKAKGDRRSASNILIQGARAWCVTNDLIRCSEMLSAGQSGLLASLPAGHSSFGTIELFQAQMALARSDLPQAQTRLKRATAIFESARDKNQFGIRAVTLLARTEQQLGDLDAAQAHAASAVALAREAMAGFAHSEWLGSALVAQGMVQKARGETAAAQASWHAALTELQATVGDSAPATEEARRLLIGL